MSQQADSVLGSKDFNAKQMAFMRSYLVCNNATQAAIEAGYSSKTAHSQGSRMLKNVKVKSAIELVQSRIAEKQNVKAEEVIEQYKTIAMANMFDFLMYDENDMPYFNLKEVERCRRHLGGAIKTLEITTDEFKDSKRTRVKVGLIDKTKFLDTLNEATGALISKTGGLETAPKVVIHVNTNIPGAPGSNIRRAEPVLIAEVSNDSD